MIHGQAIALAALHALDTYRADAAYLPRDLDLVEIIDSASVRGRADVMDTLYGHADSLVVELTYNRNGAGSLIEVMPDGTCSVWAD